MCTTGCWSTIAHFNCRVTVSCRAKVSATLQWTETRARVVRLGGRGGTGIGGHTTVERCRYSNRFICLFVNLRTSCFHLNTPNFNSEASSHLLAWMIPWTMNEWMNEWMPFYRKLHCFKPGLIKIMKMSTIILAMQTNHSPGFDRSR